MKFRKFSFEAASAKPPFCQGHVERATASTATVHTRPTTTHTPVDRIRKATTTSNTVSSSDATMALGASSTIARIMSAKITLRPLPSTFDPSGNSVTRKLAAHSIR